MTRGIGKNLLALWIACLPGILSASCSSKGTSHLSGFHSATTDEVECVHGVCSDRDICVCNPCWSGPTCQDYVDRFAPRFLAEEPFFILDAEPWLKAGENSWSSPERGVLFRLEAADDDLGLTCQLGQVGPAATCPCATPRYSVVGKSGKMFLADEETGDVFLRQGFILQPNTHYLITLQVSTLKVNASGYRNWKEKLTVTLYIRSSSKDNGFNGLENGLVESLGVVENKTTDSSSSSESLEFSNSFPLPELSLGRMTADSIFRYKREIKRRAEVVPPMDSPNIQISFFRQSTNEQPPQSLDKVGSWRLLENIKVEARLELGLMREEFGASALTFQVQISTNSFEENGFHGLAIGSANVSFVGSAISYSSNSTIQSPILQVTKKLPYPDTAVWEWRDVRVALSSGENELPETETQIIFELNLFPFYLANKNSSSTLPKFSKNLRIEAKIIFLHEEDEEDGEGGTGEEDVTTFGKEQQISTFMNIPLRPSNLTKTYNQTVENSKEIRVELSGPFAFSGAEGVEERKFYTIKVYMDEPTSQVKVALGLSPIGNQTKSHVSIEEIQLKSAGSSLLSCCPLEILQSGFELRCSSKERKILEDASGRGRGGGGGDSCSISSPLVNLCLEGKDESNVLEFQGIIYGLPDASPDSQFVLTTHVSLLNGLLERTTTTTTKTQSPQLSLFHPVNSGKRNKGNLSSFYHPFLASSSPTNTNSTT